MSIFKHDKYAKERKQFKAIRDEHIRIQQQVDEAEINNYETAVYQALQAQLDEISQKEKEFREYYAKRIFNDLSLTRPTLIRRRDEKEVSWREAFGNDYSRLSPELKASVIALIELNGGQYRLK